MVKVDVTKPPKKSKRKNRFSVIISPVGGIEIKPKLTLRTALSIHAKPYDPLGLILPCKMVGNLLLRLSICVMKKEVQGPVPWDDCIVGDLEQRWIKYFEMLVALKNITFPRSFKPPSCDPDVIPVLATFSDGNPDSFGTCGYSIWTLKDGSKVARLIMSKAKLSAILQKGETVKNELLVAAYNCRLKEWILKHSGIQFGEHVAFIDSKIVQAIVLA